MSINVTSQDLSLVNQSIQKRYVMIKFVNREMQSVISLKGKYVGGTLSFDDTQNVKSTGSLTMYVDNDFVRSLNKSQYEDYLDRHLVNDFVSLSMDKYLRIYLGIEDNDTANKNLVFENCYIESQNNWAIGMGMRGGCYVEFNKCDLVGNDNSHGGLFFHDSAIDEYLGEQTIRCIDTNIFSIGTNTSDLKIQSQCKDGSTVNVEFIRTNVRNITNGKQTKVFLNDNNGVYTNVANIEDLTNFNLSKSSYGNSMEILNY